jgi:hypothetical protein
MKRKKVVKRLVSLTLVMVMCFSAFRRMLSLGSY